MKMRKTVMGLLIFTVLAPIFLYTDTFTSRNELKDVPTFPLGIGGDYGKQKFLHQESYTSPKETVGTVYVDNSVSDEGAEIKSIPGLISNTTEALRLPEPVEDRRRVLHTTNDGDQTQMENNNIRQVTDELNEANQKDVLQDRGSTDEEEGHKEERESVKEEIKHEQPSGQTTTAGIDATLKKHTSTERQDNHMVLPDARIRQLKDQLIRARVYISLIATKKYPQFIRELRVRMKEVQRALGEATKDSELSRNAHEKMKAMEQTLAKGKQIQDDCATVVKKLRAMLHSTEEQLRLHKKQTMFLTQLTAKTLPKGLHCLPLRLSTEYYVLNSSQQQFPYQDKLEDRTLYHYALFSDNILAASVVVNSTISNAKDPSSHVFHIVTDRLNYAAMRMWFLTNPPGKATIQVQNVENFTWLNSSYSPVLKQLSSASMIDFYFKPRHDNSDANLKFRNPKYLSILNHLRFYLPEIFPKLNKVLFLDDDIIVQKDLTGLWSTYLKGNVNGAVETCGESFHRFDRYLNFSNPLISKNFDPHACGWAYGMNIFDLDQWKKQNITELYHSWQNLNHDRQLWKLGTLPPGLITFYKRTYPLNRSWHVLGLGYNPNVNQKDIERAAVIHYNGNMKPWLEIGIQKYRNYWTKFVNYDHLYLRECNINP